MTFGVWATQGSPSVTEMAVHLGLDWVCVSLEHGYLEVRDVLAHVRAARRSDTAVVVRVPAFTQDWIKRVLDVGADGVIAPLVRSAEDVALAARYAPAGVRGIGGDVSSKWGVRDMDYLRSANEEIMVIPLVETAEATANFADIVAVPGIEAVYFGPADLSASLGYVGDWEGPGVAERILEMKDTAAAAGVASGVMVTGAEDGRRRVEQGFRMIGLGTDTQLLFRQLTDIYSTVR